MGRTKARRGGRFFSGGGRGGQGARGGFSFSAHHSLVCVQALLIFFINKERTRPPVPPPPHPHTPNHHHHSVARPPMGLWTCWRQKNSLCITILPYSIAKQTVCDDSKGDFPFFSFFFFNQKSQPSTGLFNIQNQALSHLGVSVLTNK